MQLFLLFFSKRTNFNKILNVTHSTLDMFTKKNCELNTYNMNRYLKDDWTYISSAWVNTRWDWIHISWLTINKTRLKWIHIIWYWIYIHPMQVPRWDVPQWLPRSIVLLKVPIWSQIMPLRPIDVKVFFTPVIKKLYPRDFWKNWWSPLK